MPEDLPTPKKSLKQLEKENKRSLKKKEKQLINLFHNVELISNRDTLLKKENMKNSLQIEKNGVI